VAWNHDGSQLAAGYVDGINVWDQATQQQVANFETAGSIGCVAWSPDGSLLAFNSGHKTVTLCDVSTKTELFALRGHLRRVTAVCWHPKGHRIATGSIEGVIKIWKTAETPRVSAGAAAISWNPRGSRYASRNGDSVVICDPENPQALKKLKGHTRYVYAVSWSPDGTSVASASYDGEVRIWDETTGAAKHSIQTQITNRDSISRLPSALAWSPDSRRLAYLETDNSIRIADAQTGEKIHDLTGNDNPLRSFAWSPDGSLLATGGYGQLLQLWNPLTGQLENSLGALHEYKDVSVVCWSPDGSRIAAATGDNIVYIGDVATGLSLHQLIGHTTYVHTVSWSLDGQRIASADESGSVRIWDARTGQQTLALSYPGGKGVPMVAWSPDGQSLAGVAFGGNAAVRIWNVRAERSTSVHW
jgi:WD40 repeat protein